MAMKGQARIGGRIISGTDGEMSLPEKQMMFMVCGSRPELPYPMRRLEMAWGRPETEYDIPDADRQKVLVELYPFEGVPKLDDEMFDLHELKTFRVRDYRVIRWNGANLLASPYFPRSGGMLVDWVEPGSEDKAAIVKIVKKEARDGE